MRMRCWLDFGSALGSRFSRWNSMNIYVHEGSRTACCIPKTEFTYGLMIVSDSSRSLNSYPKRTSTNYGKQVERFNYKVHISSNHLEQKYIAQSNECHCDTGALPKDPLSHNPVVSQVRRSFRLRLSLSLSGDTLG